MSFNGYRSMIPNRSRYPISVQQHQQQQPVPTRQLPAQRPMRASSYDPYTARSSSQPQSKQSYIQTPHSQGAFAHHNTLTSTHMAYPPLLMDFDAAYFSKGATSEATLNSEIWCNGRFDEHLFFTINPNDVIAFNADTSMGKASDFDDFGLGLGSLNTDMSTSTVTADTELFGLPEINTEVNTTVFGGSSPDGHTWSTLSDSSGGMKSDFSDVAAEADLACLGNDFPFGFDFVLPSIEDTVPTCPQPSLQKPSGSHVARSSPSHRYRTSPYPAASATSNASRARSFTTGSMAVPKQRGSPFTYCAYQLPNLMSQHTSPLSCPPSNISISQEAEMTMFCTPEATLFDGFSFNDNTSYNTSYQEPQTEASTSCFAIAAELDSNLPSSLAAKSQWEHQFAGSSEPPNLFGPLTEAPLSPPPEDFNCENEDDIPRVQDLRFEGDLYTPKYVRGHGNKREGWCGICKPGRWLVLKNSAFWYDKSFTHGISAATGAAFESPRETRRMKSSPDVWEGLCHSCDEWIALISSKKKGTTWFRHAYKVIIRGEPLFLTVTNVI